MSYHTKRGRPSKYGRASAQVEVVKAEPRNDLAIPKTGRDSYSEEEDHKKRLVNEVDCVKKLVGKCLKTKSDTVRELEKRILSLENEKSAAILASQDNMKLASRIKMESTKQKEQLNTLLEEKNALKLQLDGSLQKNKVLEEGNAKKDKDIEACKHKITRLVELIDPLRGKVTDQENLRKQINEVNYENKALHINNEELEKALEAKESELQKAKIMLEKTSNSIAEEEIRLQEDQKKFQLLSTKLKSDEKKIQGTLQEMKDQLSQEKKKLGDEREQLEKEKRSNVDDKQRLEMQWESLNKEKKKLIDELKFLDEEKKELENDRMTIDMEWGDIMTRKKVLEQSEQSHLPKEQNIDKQDELNMMEAKNDSLQQEINLKTNEYKDHLNMMEARNDSLQQQINFKTKEYEELSLKYIYLEEQLHSLKEGSAKEFSNLKDSYSNKKLAKEVLEADVKSKKTEINKLKEELSSLEKSLEKQHESYLSQKQNFEKIIESKDEELEKLRHVFSTKAHEKRKLSGEEDQTVALKKFKSSEPPLDSLDTEESLDYLPSDEETGIDLGTLIGKSYSSESYDTIGISVHESIDANVDKIDDAESIKRSDETVIEDKSSRALRQIAEFESFIKSKRSKDSSLGEENGNSNDHPNTEQAVRSEDVSTDDKEKLDLDFSLNQFSRRTKEKSMRDLFDDSEESGEEELVTQDQQPLNLKDRDANSTSTSINSEAGLTTPAINRLEMKKVSLGITKSDDPPSTKLSPEKPLLALKDIKALTIPCPDLDILIPSISSIGDSSIEVSDTEDFEAKLKQELVEKELKFSVAEVVKNVLNLFYKKDNGIPNSAIESKDEFERLAADFTNKFKEDIKDNYLESNDDFKGMSMSEEDRQSIIDQIYFHFRVKNAITNFAKNLKSDIVKRTSLDSNSNLTLLTSKLSDEIKASYKLIHNTLLGVSLTADNRLWIKNKIDIQFSSEQ